MLGRLADDRGVKITFMTIMDQLSTVSATLLQLAKMLMESLQKAHPLESILFSSNVDCEP